ncbi:Pleckstrin y domain containing, M (with RUN domain) member 1 [Balamuthia mandrillaris]
MQQPTKSRIDSGMVRQSLLGYLQTSVKFISAEYAATGAAITGKEEEGVSMLFDAIERVLNYGLLSDGGFFSQSLSVGRYWRYVEHVIELDTARPPFAYAEQVRWVRRNVSEEEQRGRTWLRLALNKQSLWQCFNLLVKDRSHTSKWYESHAILRQPDDCAIFLTMMQGVSSVAFALPLLFGASEKKNNSSSSSSSSSPTSLQFIDPHHIMRMEQEYLESKRNNPTAAASSSSTAPTTTSPTTEKRKKRKKAKRRVAVIEEEREVEAHNEQPPQQQQQQSQHAKANQQEQTNIGL